MDGWVEDIMLVLRLFIRLGRLSNACLINAAVNNKRMPHHNPGRPECLPAPLALAQPQY